MKRQWFNKERKPDGEVAEVYGKNGPSIHEIVKKGEEMSDSFAITPQVAKIMAPVTPVHDAYLVKMKKSLSFVQ